jgi:membrane protease YdiL (CAAX protease family)
MNHLESIIGKKNQWWRYPLLFLTAFIGGQFLGAIPLGLFMMYKMIQNGDATDISSVDSSNLSQFGLDQNLTLFLIIIPFIVSLILFAVLIKPIHQQTFKAVINGTRRIRWSKFFNGFLVWIAIMAIYLAIDYNLNPGNFVLNFSLEKFIPLVIISVLLIPFQTTLEEVMFRGYLAQGVAAWTRNRVWVILIPAFLFGMMHVFNPEIKEYGFWLTMPQYMIFGLVFGLITVLDDGIEIAMGAHAANNIFLSVFVTFKASALETPALFVQKELDPVKDLISLFVISILFVAILYRKNNWDMRVLFRPVEKVEFD